MVTVGTESDSVLPPVVVVTCAHGLAPPSDAYTAGTCTTYVVPGAKLRMV